MIKYIILLFGIALISCNSSENNKQNAELTPANFDWLLGEWQRVNEQKGRETFEIWEKVNELEYSGRAWTIQNSDTIFQEQMSFYKSGDLWNLSVKTPDEIDNIIFNGIMHTENKFIVVNKEIDFPNQIIYWTEDGKLYATVSNSEINLSFEFEIIKE
ncbi:MAG TPA: hypothetical protein VLZ75_09780 [Chitinophagales bacterium]|nr:hypothetical protein [Chitinophagales bacterium]